MPRVQKITCKPSPDSNIVDLRKVPEAIDKAKIRSLTQYQNTDADGNDHAGVIINGVTKAGALIIPMTEGAVKAGLFKAVGDGYVHAFGATFTKKEGRTLDTIIL